jgi:hypothetical protein
MMDFFQAHEIPDSTQIDSIRFATPGPHISPDCHWFTLGCQERIADLSTVQLDRDRQTQKISVRTTNIASWGIRLSKLLASDTPLPVRLSLEIDAEALAVEGIEGLDQTIWFDKVSSGGSTPVWQQRTEVQQQAKVQQQENSAVRDASQYGVFKEAFRNRFVLVYGTRGDPEENRWMLGKARYDAETFWYRGNGSVDCWSDADYLALAQRDPQSLSDRNVILYGNSTVNEAWGSLLARSPVQLQRGSWTRGGPEVIAESVSMLLVRPKSLDTQSKGRGLVAGIGGTDLAGMRASARLPIFSSGTGYPDVLVVSPEYLKTGSEAVRWTGFFGTDWSVGNGEWLP